MDYTSCLWVIPYCIKDSTYEVRNKIESYRFLSDGLKRIRENKMPLKEISVDYDHDIMQLVFQMRHQLFNIADVKLTPRILRKVLQYYEEFDFKKNSVAEIFVKNEEGKTAHYKIKCEIVFGLNLHNLLEKAGLLSAFEAAVLFQGSVKEEPFLSFEYKPSAPPSVLAAKCAEMLPCFPNSNIKNELGYELIPNNSLSHRLSFLEPLFRIVRMKS
ncbi:hypothetical protein ENBRE01_2476 [Enteropsectra breve]|nr:hypothetical protein ENBRE01_2476 [Enteropsectra breve]